MIPKKIHYCWFGSNPYPKEVKRCIETWKEHFPDYTFFLWNEKNSPMDAVYVQEAYIARKYAFVSDYIRIWALYNEGGIYLDTDIYVIRPMNDLLTFNCFFGWETLEQKAISCGVIGCKEGDRFVKKILEQYDRLHFGTEYIEQLVIPRIVTSIYNKTENKDGLDILPYDYFYPLPYEDREQKSNFLEYATENTYAIHLWSLSWVSKFNKLISKIVRTIKKYL